VLPTENFSELVREHVMPIAPASATRVHFSDGSITQANEQAITAAMIKYAKDNNMRDASKLSVIGFKNGTHGTSAMTLSCSDPELNVNNT